MPEPLITWTQNGRPVNENKVILQQGGRSLIVNNVDRADAGEYICRAQNAAGQDMQKYELEIHIPPKIIEGSPTETAFKETIRGENLELSCDFDFTFPKECFRSLKLFHLKIILRSGVRGYRNPFAPKFEIIKDAKIIKNRY